MPVEEAQRIFQFYASQAESQGNCLFTHLKLSKRQYPRIALNKQSLATLNLSVQKEILKHSGVIRVALHQIAYRATGNFLPAYDQGQDISHLCKKGEILVDPKKDLWTGIQTKSGCFSQKCLKIESHADNLKRSRCRGVIDCPRCKYHLNMCVHTPMCEDEKKTEDHGKKISKVIIVYDDGTEDVFPNK